MIKFHKSSLGNIFISYQEKRTKVLFQNTFKEINDIITCLPIKSTLSDKSKIHEITYGEFKLIAQLQPNLTIYRYLALLNKLGE